MRKLLIVLALSAFARAASAQATQVPVCDGFDGTGQPVVTATNSTNCTDYFGVGNWANSPLPAGSIAGFTLVSAGSGYVNPVVVINDPAGTGATATATVTGGAITAVAVGTGGSGYVIPQVSIVDVGVGGTLGAPTCGGTNPTACGSGAMVTAVLGGPFTGGMPKFQAADTLPSSPAVANGALTRAAGGLQIAVPDTTTFPGSDYYEIGLVQYTQRMHSSLPPTTLRGYVQFVTGSSACAAAQTVAPPSYLGPTIVAQRNRPVRVKFTNCLPTGAGGNLFIPVDTTYMGAGLGPDGVHSYLQSRAVVHLHGGVTPWISDGTPHQWTVPQGESTTYMTGDSMRDAPDMYFVNGVVVPQCSATVTANCSGGAPAQLPQGATNDPGQGSVTLYWTNQQTGRLMFYHDHAYGTTRLNVYAGVAAGYLLVDPAEEDKLANASAPGTIGSTSATQDLAHLIPLVIQDKTFVPSPAQINAQDPTWGANFGTRPGTANPGDLWFPHVYVTNQNPSDPGGGNGYGRWDYGPWFWPPQTNLSAAVPNVAYPGDLGVTVKCTSSAFPGQTLAPTQSCPTCGCPIIPNPSGTPEGFMDTPVVNGVAYPVLHVAPEAYRFRILSVGNDRSFNLSWFVADGTQKNTEVAMVPAAPPAATNATIPLCTTLNPVTNPSLVMGLAGALLDPNTGNPLNGTGLPAGCWPNYGPQPGIPAPQTMWAADGRGGGAPDPRNAGPAWVQIGSEGGLLPAPVVIPPTPVNYEQNTRSITITNVAVHGLWLGPAERADVIVDFSQFAGKTLILYNDAPTPAPAFDSRLDYFTGDGDQSPIGGAPNTQPGYGPNTRTVMQVVVDGKPTATTPFSVSALKAAFASTSTTPGLFAASQPTTIIPESAYDSAYNATFPDVYSAIQSTSLIFTPITPLLFDQPCLTQPGAPAQCGVLDRKTIQELFTFDYGRMNALLGVELPLTSFTNQTTIQMGYTDWPTEIIQQGDTQLWKVTHNGVDTHFIHFHLFNVQVVNRMGWDGTVRPPDENELGWKETVRMNPLEDVLVALQPITPTLPFPLPDSIRPNDVTKPTGVVDMSISGVDPNSGNALNGTTIAPGFAGGGTTNEQVNFGWEYVWHCHILGHEENDMMRPIIYQVPPAVPTNLIAVQNPQNASDVVLTWTDNSASETSFTVQRDTTTAFAVPTPITVDGSNAPAFNTAAYGGTITIHDTVTPGTTYFYRVQANDSFLPPGASVNLPTTPPFQTMALSSGWSNIASATANMLPPVVTFTGAPATATYNTTFTVTATTNASSMPIIAATGGCSVGTVTGAPGSATALVKMTSGTTSCSLTASWPSDGVFLAAGPLTQTTAAALATPTIAFTGAPVTASAQTTFTVTATTDAAVAPTITATAGVCGAGTVAGTSPATAVITMTSGAGKCVVTATWAATANYAAATLSQSTMALEPLTVTASSPTLAYGGPVPAITPVYSGLLPPDTALTPAPTCTTTATSTSLPGAYPSSCTGPASTTRYAPITYVNGTVTVTKAGTATLMTAAPNPAIVGQIVTVSFTVAPQYAGTPMAPTGSVTVTASTGEACSAAVAAGSCALNFYTGGARTITATYAGDVNFTGSTSAPVTETVSSVSLSTTSLLFGDQLVGTSSARQTVTLSNVGTVALAIGGIGITGADAGDFAQNSNCPVGGTLPAGRSCSVNVTFSPTFTGVRTATLSITDVDPTSPQGVTLTGTGTMPVAAVSPSALTFTSAMNVASAAQVVTVTNNGTAVLAINGIQLGGTNASQFTQSTNCGSTLAIGASCTVDVTFRPTSYNGSVTKTATLSVSVRAPASAPAPVSLTGTIVAPTYTLTPASTSAAPYSFGKQRVGVPPYPTAQFTVTNTGTVALGIRGVTLGGQNASSFSHTSNCPIVPNTLAAGSTCTVTVTFNPTSIGIKNATLNVRVSAPATSTSAYLTGTGY